MFVAITISTYMKAILLTLTLCFCGLLCQAQMNPMQHHMQISRMNTQIINQQRFMNNMMWQMSMNKPIKKTGAKYKFGIVTQSGKTIVSEKKMKVFFYSPLDSIVIVNKEKEKQVIYPKDTKRIFVKQKQRYVSGIPYDNSNWLFNTDSVGYVKFYAAFPESGLEYITHFRVGDNDITLVTPESLKSLVGDYPKALKHLEKKNLYKALSVYMKEEKKKEKALKKR